MPTEPVDIFIGDGQGTPLEGVLVHIFNPEGTVLFTQSITDAEGRAAFLLETLSYQARFFRFQTNFEQPQSLEVLVDGVNKFDIIGVPWEPPVAIDPRLCRCSGYFRRIDGSPHQYVDIRFIADFDPIVLEGSAVVPAALLTRTDTDGYLQIDLIQGARYNAYFENNGEPRSIRVPLSPSANLPDMLFPVVERITFAEEGPYIVPIGGELVLTPTVVDSAGVPLVGTAGPDVQWTADSAFMTVGVGAETLTLKGVAAGETELNATRANLSIIQIPGNLIAGVPLVVTVA